jgi:hypothetical protein
MEKSKRAQVTIFIIIAVLLVAGLLIIFLIWRQPTGVVSVTTNPEGFIEKCIKDYTKEAIEILSERGGDIEPEGSVLYDGIERTYLCYNKNYYNPCINQRPMLIDHIESEIRDYIDPKVRTCFDSLEEELEGKGYDVVIGDMNTIIDLQTRKVVMTIERDLKITKDQDIKSFDKFREQTSHPIYDLAEIGNEIASQEGEYCYFNVNGFNSNYPKFEVRKDMIDGSKIYSVKEKATNKIFTFAIRGCVMPPGL